MPHAVLDTRKLKLGEKILAFEELSAKWEKQKTMLNCFMIEVCSWRVGEE